MQDNIFKNLREYYQPTVLFQAHVDLILEPIHELHKLYYDNVLESKQFIYQKGYELAELEVLNKIQEHVSMKSDTSPIFHPEDLSSLLEKDQLFGTSKSAAAKLEKDTFNASQKTLTRVDKDINNILVDSYREGVGYKEVGRRLTKKFNQLQTFEAERIARTETHSAHELGTMQAFEDLDVEYLQWDAHLDNRVRETHEEINGEIIPLGGTFSNGLKYPGDKNGPIKEWINCRCHGVPYILPPGAIAPNMPYFRESDLIYVNQPKLEINKAVNTIENKVESPIWNFTLQDEKRLTKLESEKIGLLDPRRKELKFLQYKRELRELFDEGEEILPKHQQKYDKLLKAFNETKISQTTKPAHIFDDNFEFTPEGRAYYRNLKMKKKLGEINSDEKRELKELMEKNNFGSTYRQYNSNEQLSYEDSKRYIKTYYKYGEKWGLSLDTSKFSLMSSKRQQKLTNFNGAVEELSSKFKITGAEEKRFNNLLLKRLLNEGKLDVDEAKELRFLYSKQRFNYLYSLNKQDKGLDYEAYREYSKLFRKYKSKLNLSDDLLDIYVSDYKSKIPLDKNTNYFKTFKGTDDEGLLPDGANIKDYFTIDARDMTPREKIVAERWLGPDYRMFTDFDVVCNRDVERYAKFVYNSRFAYEKYDTWEKCLDLAKDIAYDTKTLDNILNNQLKQSLTLWRVQEGHFLDSTKVGDIVDLPDFRSSSISKKGALWFSETNDKPMKYIFEIEAPKGTKGAFLAPIKQGQIANPTNIHYGENYANEMEFLLKNSKVKIVAFDDKKIKGALGEELIHVKLRIVDSGGKKEYNKFLLEKLNKLPQNKKYAKLGPILNRAQQKKYVDLVETEEHLLNQINSTFDENELRKLNKQLNNVSNEKLKYEKLIYNPKPTNTVTEMDKAAYKIDTQGIGYDIDKSILESKQIAAQKNIAWTPEERAAINRYYSVEHWQVNGYIKNSKEYVEHVTPLSKKERKKFIREVKQNIEHIDSAMAKTEGLSQKTTLYRYGEFDADLNNGDVGIWNEVTSTSFQESSAKGFDEEIRYNITILADKGQKGIAANDSRFSSFTHEHEFTLPRRQKYEVIDVDHKNRTATVLLID